MKRIIYSFLQFLLFIVLVTVGSFWHPFQLRWGVTQLATGGVRYFIPDGVLLALAAFLVIVILQAIRKRPNCTVWSVIAFLLAMAAAYALKLGFVTQEIR